jgi:hypothetical protein
VIAPPGLRPIIIGLTLQLVSPSFSAGSTLSIDAVQPGAHVVWCLKRRATAVQCVVLSRSMPVEVQVVHGTDVVVTEMFQEEWMALKWARAYRERLRAQGWNDVAEALDPGV